MHYLKSLRRRVFSAGSLFLYFSHSVVFIESSAQIKSEGRACCEQHEKYNKFYYHCSVHEYALLCISSLFLRRLPSTQSQGEIYAVNSIVPSPARIMLPPAATMVLAPVHSSESRRDPSDSLVGVSSVLPTAVTGFSFSFSSFTSSGLSSSSSSFVPVAAILFST